MKKILVSSTEKEIQVNIQVSGFYTKTVETPNGPAKVITVPKALNIAEAGEPDVPMTGIPVMIGDRARMDVRVIDAEYMDFEGIEVAPSKGDFPRTIDPDKVPYTYGKCYSQDAFFPAKSLEIREPYIIRDFRGQNMAVYPFAYNPITKTLRVYYNMTVEMFKVDDNGENVIENRRGNVVKMSSDFKSVYQRHFINYEASMAKYTPVDDEGDMLIICYDNFISSMTDFVNWKKTRGINTTIVGTSTAGSTYTAIQSYIASQYNANHNLTHVLLVGDVAQIPGYTYTGASGYEGKGDNPYGQIVGNDIYNDVFIGRFSAQNTTQVNTQVQRIITYERDLKTSDTWCQNGLGVSKNEGGSGHNGEDDYQHIENIRTDLLNFGYSTVYQDYNGASGYPSTSTTTISNHINSGVGVINYCNHGSQTAWQSHNYTNSHVNALTNDNKLPFVFSVACYNGQYDYDSGDCFGEAWLHATNGNAPTGAIGGTFSYISQPWIPPMWAQDEFVDILVESYSNNIKHTFGGAAVNGMMGIFDNYSTTTAQAVGTYQAWIVFGDPSLMMRTKTPQAMTVTHSGSLPIGTNSYSISVSKGDGALATITDADHNILGQATVNGTTANITINGNLTVGSDLTLCVFGYNKVTYLGTIQVVSNDNPYITADSYNPTLALVGDDTDMSITFKNVGSQSTTGTTTVTLSSTDNVTIIDNMGSFGTLAANASVTVNGFKFRINNGTTLGEAVTLHYTAVNGNDTWEGDLGVTANQIVTVTVASNNTDYGTVSGGGQFNYGQSCTVIATPADGYMLSNWTVNGNVVSSDTEYTFNVNSDIDLVANFAAGVMIGTGNNTSDYLPSYNYYKYSLTEQIYTSDELGGVGYITRIAFYNGGAEKTRTLDLYMKATTKSTFSSKTDWIAVSSADKVFSGSVTMVADDWTTITFTTPFLYDGNSNIVLVTDDNTGSYTNSPHMSCNVFDATNQAIYIYSDNTNYDPSSPTTSQSSNYALLSEKNQLIITKEAVSTEPVNITVSINPEQAGTVSGGGEYPFGETCTVTATPNAGYFFIGWTENGIVVSSDLEYTFAATTNRNLVATFIQAIEIGEGATNNTYIPSYSYYKQALTQQIYTADEINVAGTINSIAFYNEGAEKTRTYDFYLKSTDKSSFSSKTDWITVAESDKVFSGSVTMAANTWTFINLSTPFEYDGNSNIVLVADDNTGNYTNSPHMACSVYNTNTNQALYVYNDNTNYNPSSPSSYSGTLLTVKNHLLMGVTPNTGTQYEVTVTVNPEEGGTVSGAGTYYENGTCRLIATANTDYAFANWTKDGEVVGTEATYSFTVTEDAAYTANFTYVKEYTINAMPNSVEYGSVAFGSKGREELVYDFEDGTYQGWTLLKGNTGDSPNNWMHVNEYVRPSYATSNYGHDSSDGWMLSESYISTSSSGGGSAVTPDNYIVSPQVRLGGSINFWVTDGNDSYGAEHFALLVSTTDNTSTGSFTQIQEWTLLSKGTGGTRSFTNGTWYEYTVDLSEYSGMGYLAIRHFNCSDMWILGLDDITIVEGEEAVVDDGSISGIYIHGNECTVIATPNEGYSFQNWTEDGEVVSNDSNYTFTVDNDRNLVANFVMGDIYHVEVTINPAEAGYVLGAGSFEQDETCILTAQANMESYSFLNWTENGEVVSYDNPYTFTVENNRNIVANFIEKHFVTDYSQYPDNMSAVSVVYIDGVEQSSPLLELGAFAGDEARGSDIPMHIEMQESSIDSWMYLLVIQGETGENITFRLYDHESQQELDLQCITNIEWNEEAGYDYNFSAPLEIHFITGEIQTNTLSSGWNNWSTNLDITLDDLKAALVAAAPGTVIIIKSQTEQTKYNPNNGRWSGQLNSLDLTQMYRISVGSDCETTLEGTPIDPAEHPITISNGANWIAFPLSTEMSLTDAFAGFAVQGDMVKSQNGNAQYNRGRWQGQLNTLVPGNGYKYISNVAEDRVFTFPTSGKGMNAKNIGR